MVLRDAETLYPSLQATVMALNERFLELSTQSVHFIKSALVILKEVADINYERLNCQEMHVRVNHDVPFRETSVLFQGEDPVFCKRPVSSYPRHILTYHEISCYDREKGCMHPSLPYLLSRTCSKGIGFENRVRLTLLLHSFYTELEHYTYQAGCNIESVINFEIYELVTNEAVTKASVVRRGIKRSWKIEHSAASLWKKVATENDTEHLTYCTELPRRFRGVRYRSGRAKNPWIAEIKLPKEKKKTHIGCFGTCEEAARAYDVAAIYAGKDTPLNFQESLEFMPPKGFENFIRKGQADYDVPTQSPLLARNRSWTACSLRPKETRLCLEQRIASQENASGAFIGIEEIGETSLLPNAPPAIEYETSPNLHMSHLQEMNSASLPTTSGGLSAANMPLPTYLSQVPMDTDEAGHGRFECEVELAPEISKEVDPGMLDLEDWTERLIELMDGSDPVQRSAPSVSDPLNFPFGVLSDSLITQSDTNIIPDFHQNMIHIPSINQAAIAHTTSITDLNQLELSPGTPLQQEFPPGQETIVPRPSFSGGGPSYANLEETTESGFSFVTAFHALINVGDFSRNMELLLQLVKQHYDKQDIEVVLRPK